MSKDWTPRQLFLVDRYLQKEKGNGFRNILETTTVSFNGETSPYFTEREIESRKLFPEFSFLFNGYTRLWEDFSEHPEIRADIFKKVEETLLAIEKSEVEEEMFSFGTRLQEMTFRWFDGKLDPCFYYSTYNDEAFYDFLTDFYKNEITPK